ncbi:hypothetical protein IV102_25250 [bacterium]|nr:hypothetical protein [bacterium]
MKRLLVFLLLTGALGADPDSLIPPDPHTVNGFSRSNPDYRYRAAHSYEQAYFPKALASLRQRASLGESSEPMLRIILQGFTYRWLDRYVLREGKMPRADLTETMAWMDSQMSRYLSPKQFSGYQGWCHSPDNPMAFLFLVHTSSSGPDRP